MLIDSSIESVKRRTDYFRKSVNPEHIYPPKHPDVADYLSVNERPLYLMKSSASSINKRSHPL